MKKMSFLVAAAIVCLGAWPAMAEDAGAYNISIQDHRFIPETLTVPAGQKVKLVITNKDTTPEEFESFDLNREKIIKGGGKAAVFIGPLKKGSYSFFGEFNEDTAQGRIVAE